jgi:hypothetical protein
MKAAAEGATECVRRLLEAGANPGQTDKTDTTDERTNATLREINADNGLDLDPDVLDFSKLPGEAAIAKAANLDIVRLLVAAGEDLNDISDEMRAELTGRQTDGEVVCTAEEYAAGKHRRFGTANPKSCTTRSGRPWFAAVQPRMPRERHLATLSVHTTTKTKARKTTVTRMIVTRMTATKMTLAIPTMKATSLSGAFIASASRLPRCGWPHHRNRGRTRG